MEHRRGVPHRYGIVLGLQLFNAISAIGGGIALMIGLIDQPVWVTHTAFPDLYLPGVILFAIVGGSALVAALAMAKRVVGRELASILAGVVMLAWIIGEIASIRGLHVLQAVYLVTGAVAIWLTPGGDGSGQRRVDPGA
ncbi:hypothetical protein GA0111570_108122 [Raineyella antarctica]|uniref:Uncharacterized protein n=1 Tax=Raineyella antarctica TaxID=1577474 RepID=A0A1G6HCE9_9ACTN|nr:hypothetical protein [Raineyella antarctica]SDB91824.1 hypothetical protein GA0111570_108122 [Raineyella antarctica]